MDDIRSLSVIDAEIEAVKETLADLEFERMQAASTQKVWFIGADYVEDGEFADVFYTPLGLGFDEDAKEWAKENRCDYLIVPKEKYRLYAAWQGLAIASDGINQAKRNFPDGLNSVDISRLNDAIHSATAAMEDYLCEINEIPSFPVPHIDTGLRPLSKFITK